MKHFRRRPPKRLFTAKANRFRRFLSREDGAVLLETTIMLPLLLTLCAGVFEFGSLFYQRMLVETGVRDAGRYMSRCTLAGCSEAVARNIAVFGDPGGGGTARVDGWTTGDVTFTYIQTTNDDGAGNRLYRGGGQIVTVRVSSTVSLSSTGLLDYLGISPWEVTATHEQRVVGW